MAGTWDADYTSVFHFSNGSVLSYADSIGNVSLSATGSASPSAFSGKIDGGALLNNTGGGVSLSGPSSDLTNPGAKTFEAWINPASFQSSAWPTGIIVYGKPNNVIYSMQLVADGNGADGVPAFTIDNGTSFQAVDGRPINPSTWHHLVGVVAPGSVFMYVDGVQYSATASTPKPGDSSFNLVMRARRLR